MKKLLTVLGASTAVLLGLTACGTTAEAPAEEAPAASAEFATFDELVEAAQAEGKLSVYGQIPEPSMLEFAEGFEAEYGITVDAIRLGGNTLAARFDSEMEAGSPSADVVIAVDVDYLKTSHTAGNMKSFSESGAEVFLEGFPENAVFEEFDAPALQVLETGFIYNTDKVQESDIPTSWADLSSDRWANKYCGVDPSTSVNVAHFYWQLREDEGEDVVTQVGENVGRWYPNVVAMNEAVAVGECELGLGSAKFFVTLAQGSDAPVEYAEQPMAIPPLVSAAVSSKAAHPAAAVLFLTYILDQENNKILNNADSGSLGPWDMDRMPEGWTPPTAAEFQSVREENPEVIALLGF